MLELCCLLVLLKTLWVKWRQAAWHVSIASLEGIPAEISSFLINKLRDEWIFHPSRIHCRQDVCCVSMCCGPAPAYTDEWIVLLKGTFQKYLQALRFLKYIFQVEKCFIRDLIWPFYNVMVKCNSDLMFGRIYVPLCVRKCSGEMRPGWTLWPSWKLLYRRRQTCCGSPMLWEFFFHWGRWRALW